MKMFFAVVLSLSAGAGGMYGFHAYQEHQAEEDLNAAFQDADENVKAFLRCIGNTDE
jgi:hypothetical protein